MILEQAWEFFGEESHEVQQRQVQSSTPGEEEPRALVQDRGWSAGEEHCGEGLGCSLWTTVCPFGQEDWCFPGMHEKEYG